ncbi:MAG: thioredoxin domain-containing protein [Tepidisphaeraceae bacterium]|jgi:protein-disulfide isomerase
MAILKVPVTPTDHMQGDKNALVVLVEYGDYECPHCGHAYPIVKRVQRHFGQRLAFVFRNFPLSEMHPSAQVAAEAAEFAAAHGRFWEMHDGIYDNQPALGVPLLLELAEELKLSAPALGTALSDHEYAARVRDDFLGGVRSGVNGTPTFFINGHRHDGPFEFDDLVAAIDARLVQAKATA